MNKKILLWCSAGALLIGLGLWSYLGTSNGGCPNCSCEVGCCDSGSCAVADCGCPCVDDS